MSVTTHPPRPSHLAHPTGGTSPVPQLMMIGTSHKSAGVAFRESLVRAVGADHILESLDSAKEVAVLSTCNRFELYAASTCPDATSGSFFSSVEGATGRRGVRTEFYQARGAEVAGHLFRVATGLESVVIGESQILAQVRAAGVASRKEGTAGAILGPLFDRAYRVGSRVRNEFGFRSEEASLSDLAVDAVMQASPGRHDVLLIGTGKMVKLAAKRLAEGDSRVYVATRRKTSPTGLEGAVIVPYSKIKETAAKCDVIISATSGDRPVLAEEDLKGPRRKMVVDLGMPRNVSPGVRRLANVRLFDLDDLAKVAATRKAPATLEQAERAAVREAEAFHDWLVQTRLSSALADLYSWADAVRAEEAKRALGRLHLDSDRDRKVLEAMGRRMVSKLLAKPTLFARKRHDYLSEEEKLDLLRSVFGVGS